MNPKGVNIRQSKYAVKETIDRFAALVQERGATVYARINQQSEANNAGIDLCPLEFLLFGNPKGGGPVMAQNPLVALDLPLKVIAWEDNEKKVWIAYNDPAYIAERYLLKPDANAPFNLDNLIDVALEN